jgi:hypothetical protein
MMRAHFSISVLRNVSSAVGVARPSSTDYQAAYPNTAAQTRIVSGGAFWPIRGELSQHLKYMAGARIFEFESSHASHAVSLCRRFDEIFPIIYAFLKGRSPSTVGAWLSAVSCGHAQSSRVIYSDRSALFARM